MLRLAAAALRVGLITGVFFDLSDKQVKTLYKTLVNMDWNAVISTGWDPLHVQVTGITIEEAMAGERPGETSPAAGTGMTVGTSSTSSTSKSPVPTTQKLSKVRHFRITDMDTNRTETYESTTTFRPVSLLEVPYISQSGRGADAHTNDCGAACAVMLLRAYLGLVLNPDEFYTRFTISGDTYLSGTQIRNAIGSLGLLTDFRAGLSLQALFDTIAAGIPAITMLRYRTLSSAGLTEKDFDGPHCTVVIGMDSKYVYVNDPLFTDPGDGEAHPYPHVAFLQAWKDIASEPTLPNPACSAIIPIAAIGARMVRKVRISTHTLPVRSTPAANGSVVAMLSLNEVVEVRRETNGWGEIGERRWIPLISIVPVGG
jgi:hypothetical protein